MISGSRMMIRTKICWDSRSQTMRVLRVVISQYLSQRVLLFPTISQPNHLPYLHLRVSYPRTSR